MAKEPKTIPKNETPSQSAPVSIPTKSSKSKLPIVLAIIVLLFLFGFGGILIGKCLYAPQIPELFPVSIKRLPTPTPNPTANWKNFEFPSLKFKMRLPSGWTTRGEAQEKSYWYDNDKKTKYVVALGNTGVWKESNEKSTIEITTFDLNDPNHRKYFQENLDTAKSIESVKIGESGFKKYINVAIEVGPGSKKEFTFWTLEEGKMGAKFMIGDRFTGVDLEEDLLRQILSTFKFTNSTQTDETVNWKTYTNSKFLFTFKYPEKIQGAANPQIDEQSTSILLFVPDTEGTLLKIEIISNETIETQYEKDKGFIKDLSSIEKTTLNGYQGYKATFPVMALQAEIIYIEKGNYLFKIESADLKIYQQILSTFRFLESGTGRTSQGICEKNGGIWITLYNECEKVSEEVCNLLGGVYNECASVCRHDPIKEDCIEVCVRVCKLI